MSSDGRFLRSSRSEVRASIVRSAHPDLEIEVVTYAGRPSATCAAISLLRTAED